MPFLPSPEVTGVEAQGAAKSPPDVALLSHSASEFKLLTSMTYQDAAGKGHAVPESNVSVTDLASVPWLLWGLIAPYGRQLRPALLHDHQCVEARKRPPGERLSARRAADNLFRQALYDEGVPFLRRHLLWAGVSFGRYLAFRRVAAAVVLLLALVSLAWFWVAVARLSGAPLPQFSCPTRLDAWVGELLECSTSPWFMPGWFAFVVAGGLLFWKDWLPVAVALVAAPIIAPTLVVTLVTALLLWLLECLVGFVLLVTGQQPRWPGGPQPYLDWQAWRS